MLVELKELKLIQSLKVLSYFVIFLKLIYYIYLQN